MAVQILNNPSFGGRLGESLGTGLRALAEQKLNEFAQQRQQGAAAQRIQATGFNPGFAQFLSGYAPEQQVQILKQLGESGALESLLAPQESQQQYQPTPQEQAFQQMGIPGQDNQPQQFQEQPQMAEQVAAQQPQAAPTNVAQAFARPSRKQVLEQATLKEKQRGNDIRQAALNKSDNDKLLDTHAEDVKIMKPARDTALKMIDILKKHADKFPKFYATRRLDPAIWNDEDISLYDSYAKKLAVLAAQSRRGNPTNAKIKLEEAIKAGVDKPLATQLALLNDVIKESDEVFQDDLIIKDALRNKSGNIPASLREKILIHKKNPLEVSTLADALNQGAEEIEDEAGVRYYLKNGKYVDKDGNVLEG